MHSDEDRLLHIYSHEEQSAIHRYFSALYDRVFPQGGLASHFTDYVGSPFARTAMSFLSKLLPEGAAIQDIGSGFGSFVLLAREAGYDARGVELSNFEVEYAKLRLSRLRPQDLPDSVYRSGDAYPVLEAGGLFGRPVDAVTLWNVLEHLSDTRRLFALCHSLLKPGGRLFIICPNYLAWRPEAHYQLPWSPFDWILPNRFAKRISGEGRDPDYFKKQTVLVTNWGILRGLARCGFSLSDLYGTPMPLRPGRSWETTKTRLRFFNPFAQAALVCAEKM
ncbi:putative Methyltransferase type 11 [uncultured delta proteobacterium]|uniref:Putative Methyltransferase type 11 n=1 Tax=uncultured delta proteobacterium TaxID=34034 RepID=A0A212KGU7_9DELT|nr:putative Methyltransferase type 11 [uncultured delta proteobacterium]